MKRSLAVSLALIGFCALPGLIMAQTVTAPFVAKAPAIDGVVSAGEWDGAATVEGAWNEHSSATPADAAEPTVVKVCYSVDALYILFQCTDTNVQSGAVNSEFLASGPANAVGFNQPIGQPFTFGGDTDYLAVYIDPTNYDNASPGADDYSYSIQMEPSKAAKNEVDAFGNSYTYTEAGRWGGFKRLFNPPVKTADGKTQYWANGISWELKDSKILDGKTSNGFVVEWKFVWTDFDGYWRNWANEPLSGVSDIGLDATDVYNGVYGLIKAFNLDAADTVFPIGTGAVTGMPKPGLVWKIQFCRYSKDSTPQYTNWVGATGGFVSRPFGDLIFGTASGSDVAEALMHMN
ncbi:MAG: hypothetical protein AB1656_06425 [Candidatus Omnitrophota bacterium]